MRFILFVLISCTNSSNEANMRTSTNIYKRKDGLYEGRFKNGYRKDGTVKYSSVYGKTYLECKEKREHAEKSPSVAPDKKSLTMNEVFKLYIGRMRKVSSISTYMVLYKTHIAPVFGGKRVATINSTQINSFLLGRLDELTGAHVTNIKRLFMALMNFAFQEKYIAEKLTGIVAIKAPQKPVEIFTEDEQQRLEDYCLQRADRVALGVLLVLYTGIRIGELCALAIYDLDLKSRYLKVNKTMIRTKNMEKEASTKTKIIIDTPKSNSSVRDIPIPEFLVRLCEDINKKSNKNAYFLTNSLHSFMEPRNLENQFKKLLKDCCIETRNFHVLRHTFATNSLTRNYYDVKTLSEILGHSDVLMTLRKYVHSNKRMKSMQAKNMDNDWNHRRNYRTPIEKAL